MIAASTLRNYYATLFNRQHAKEKSLNLNHLPWVALWHWHSYHTELILKGPKFIVVCFHVIICYAPFFSYIVCEHAARFSVVDFVAISLHDTSWQLATANAGAHGLDEDLLFWTRRVALLNQNDLHLAYPSHCPSTIYSFKFSDFRIWHISYSS